jgi:TetR/AcrR family transcriptional repressor of nem operon
MTASPTTGTGSPDHSDTATRILDRAQERIQRCGYNAVSYGDLADDLELTTAAIHYHFPSKGDLGQALVTRYRNASVEKLEAIRDENPTLRERLTRYATLYAEMLNEGGICLCGVLAADESTLPPDVQREVQQFFRDQEDWLTEVVAADTTGGAGLRGCDTARDVAEVILATLQGAMLTTPNRNADAYMRRVQGIVESVVT